MFSLLRACLYGTSWFSKVAYTSTQGPTSILICAEKTHLFSHEKWKPVRLTEISTETAEILDSPSENYTYYRSKRANPTDWGESVCTWKTGLNAK